MPREHDAAGSMDGSTRGARPFMSHLVMAIVLAAALATSSATQAGAASVADRSATPLTLAVIGDTPYGADQADPATFVGLLDGIAADPKVRTVVHLGDIKNGSTVCSDEYFEQIARAFAASKEPVVYTPGDNEWTDCHRTNNGGFDPYERLDAVRETFFAEPGRALGRRPKALTSQAGEFSENVRWSESKVVFTTVHVVGSNNGLDPWTGALETPENAARREAEVARRIDAAVAWIDAAFDAAEASGARGVVVAMQADTFETTPMPSGFVEIIDRLEERAGGFDGDVLLLQGDTHEYLVDRPLDAAPNLTRIVVEGVTTDEWLRLSIDPRAEELFTWERIER